jgi:hypothetical protein
MRSLLSLLFVVLLALPLPAAAASTDDVKESFLAYKSAILASDGAAAADLVTQGSRELYRRYAVDAATLDRDGLDQLHVTDRVSVLLLRHSLQRSALESMSGGEVIAYSVDQGWIGKDSVARLNLGNFQVDGNAASGVVLDAAGRESPFKLEFLKEEGRWRLDLLKMLEMTRMAIVYAVQQTGMSETDFVLYVLELSTGRTPGPEIWNPPS